MSIQKRQTKTKGTTYVVRWRDPSGAPKEKTFGLKKNAAIFEASTRTDLALGSYRDPRNDRVTVSEWHGEWWPTLQGGDLSPGTIATYESLLRLHLLPVLGPRPMSTVRRIDIETWLVEKRKEGLTGSTLAKMKSLANRLFASAVDNNIRQTNPVTGLRITGNSAPKKKRPLTHDEVDRLIEALPASYKTFALVLAYCGLRPGEAIALRRRHTNGSRLLIEGALVESHGHLREGSTKTGQVREVPMMDTVASALEAHLLGRPTNPEARIFVTEIGADIRLSNFRRVLRRAVADAGLDPTITPYTFRHTCASLLAQRRVAPSLAAKVLGHHPNVFLATYAHVYSDDLATAAQALEDSRADHRRTHLRAV